MNDTAFVTVVYPGCEPYLSDFIDSLSRQTYQKFDLIVLNDQNTDISDIRSAGDISLIEINVNNRTPAKIREFGLQYLVDSQYLYAVFGDSDDWFEDNRIDVCISMLSDCDVVVNDLHLATDVNNVYENNYLSARFFDNSKVKLVDIIDKNIFGLSNTAIKISSLFSMNIDKDLVAIDWYIFSCLLANGALARFTNKTSTFYRQHNNNTVGIAGLTEQHVKNGIATKLMHYQNMEKQDMRYHKLASDIQNLKILCLNEDYFNNYLTSLGNNKVDNPLWWEDIRWIEVGNEN